MSPKVNFLVIGAQKAGTTALDHCLRQHPDIGMADVKEVHYFDDEDVFADDPLDHSAYEAHFPGTNALHGESTPIYLWWKPACERIHRYNPAMKLIAVLRDPADRAFSHWNMEVNRQAEHRDFRTAIEEEIGMLRSGSAVQDRVCSYVARGAYAEQIDRFRKLFPVEQMLFLEHGVFRDRPNETLDRVCSFLGVDPVRKDRVASTMNIGHYRGPLDPALRQIIQGYLAEDIDQLEIGLGWDLSAWRNG